LTLAIAEFPSFLNWKRIMERRSKPNKRSCRIFLEKFLIFSSFFFVAKICFFEFSEKMSNFFFMKLTIKNFRKFFTVKLIEKKIRHFFEKFEKKIFLPQKKRRHREAGNSRIFPQKSYMTFRWLLTSFI